MLYVCQMNVVHIIRIVDLFKDELYTMEDMKALINSKVVDIIDAYKDRLREDDDYFERQCNNFVAEGNEDFRWNGTREDKIECLVSYNIYGLTFEYGGENNA